MDANGDSPSSFCVAAPPILIIELKWERSWMTIGKGPTISARESSGSHLVTWMSSHQQVTSKTWRAVPSLETFVKILIHWFTDSLHDPVRLMTFPFSAWDWKRCSKNGDFIAFDAISKGGDEHITLKAVKDRFGLLAEIRAGELREVEVGCHPAMYGAKLGKSIQQKTPTQLAGRSLKSIHFSYGLHIILVDHITVLAGESPHFLSITS